MATTVEVLAAAFQDAGTPFIVGHPGGESVELMEAARQRQMRFLLMKQEVAGAMLAATWGDLTGSPGICLSTRGPGAANMVNGVAHAFLDRSPLIAITDTYSRPDLRDRPAPAHQPAGDLRAGREVEHRRSTPRRCASRCAAPCGRRPRRRRARCISNFRRARPRARPATLIAEPPLLPNIDHAGPDRADLKPALDMLGRAKRPILIVGHGRATGARPRPNSSNSPSGSARRC